MNLTKTSKTRAGERRAVFIAPQYPPMFATSMYAGGYMQVPDGAMRATHSPVPVQYPPAMNLPDISQVQNIIVDPSMTLPPGRRESSDPISVHNVDRLCNDKTKLPFFDIIPRGH